MPAPSSMTRIRRRPPASIVTSIARAPASMRVLDQFLHGRGRPLDHLARGDAVDEDGIEAADGHGSPMRLSRPGGRLHPNARTFRLPAAR